MEKTILLTKIALRAPLSNAALDRFFSQLKYVKTYLRTSLLLQCVNALLSIQVTGPPLPIFHK